MNQQTPAGNGLESPDTVEAQALARCYRLLIAKARERRARLQLQASAKTLDPNTTHQGH